MERLHMDQPTGATAEVKHIDGVNASSYTCTLVIVFQKQQMCVRSLQQYGGWAVIRQR